jgi:hypothetical protein
LTLGCGGPVGAVFIPPLSVQPSAGPQPGGARRHEDTKTLSERTRDQQRALSNSLAASRFALELRAQTRSVLMGRTNPARSHRKWAKEDSNLRPHPYQANSLHGADWLRNPFCAGVYRGSGAFAPLRVLSRSFALLRGTKTVTR